jgi:hypothetical protein
LLPKPPKIKEQEGATNMSIRHAVKAVAATGAATLCGAALVLTLGVGTAGASSLVSSDGNTTLSTEGTVSAGTPYDSGQTIEVSVQANSTLSNANLCQSQFSGLNQTCGNPTGFYYIEECVDPGGLATNLPTTPTGCEHGTEDESQAKSTDGSSDDTGFLVYDLPDATNLGAPNMVGKCDVSPNQCVIGIFSGDPQNGGFAFPHLFSAPFQVDKGDGQDDGASPGDGTPEVPLAIALPLVALLGVGGWAIRSRRKQRQQVA